MSRPPGSRIRDYDETPSDNPYGPTAVNPHSPWQLMVEEKRADLKISMRELGIRAQTPQGTIFNWLRNKRGGPPRIIYTSNLNRRFAAALQVDETELAEAYNKSLFTPVDPKAQEEAPRPVPHHLQENSHGSLRSFLAIVDASGRTSFTPAEIHQIASFILPAGTPPAG